MDRILNLRLSSFPISCWLQHITSKLADIRGTVSYTYFHSSRLTSSYNKYIIVHIKTKRITSNTICSVISESTSLKLLFIILILQDEDTMTHFGHFAKIFAYLAEYRGHLMAEAESKGWPLMRHMVRTVSSCHPISAIECVM